MTSVGRRQPVSSGAATGSWRGRKNQSFANRTDGALPASGERRAAVGLSSPSSERQFGRRRPAALPTCAHLNHRPAPASFSLNGRPASQAAAQTQLSLANCGPLSRPSSSLARADFSRQLPARRPEATLGKPTGSTRAAASGLRLRATNPALGSPPKWFDSRASPSMALLVLYLSARLAPIRR